MPSPYPPVRTPYPPAGQPPAPVAPRPNAPTPFERVHPRWLLMLVIFLAIALALVVGAGVLGYLDGLKDREERLQTQALEHYRAGVVHMEAGKYELAQAEFEEAIRLRPDFQPAWQRLRESQVHLEAIPTPTSVPLPTMPPTVETAETPPPLNTWLAEARSLYQAGHYMDAVAHINDILKVDPNYEPDIIADLLFQCYYQEALRLVGEDRMEEAVRLFDLALAIRPDEQIVTRERELAAGYLSAIGFWGADWQKAVEGFAALYRTRPDYKDVASRLFNAYVAYGDMLAEQGAWCQAAEQYTSAANLQSKPQVVQKRDQMIDNCQRNIPPPTPTEGTETSAPEAPPAGTPVPTEGNAADLRELGVTGQIYYAVYDDVRREYVLYAVRLDGSAPIEVLAGVHQPQVDRSGKHIVARALSGVNTLGLYVIDLHAGVPPAFHLITSYTQDLYPSFSADGQEVVFASDRMSKRLWTLFTTWAGGEAEPRALIQGHTPAWSPRGDTIAYKGCDDGGNQCGIYLYRVSDGSRQALLLDPSAGFPAWSPDGTRLAFMSNRDGNWEIYLIGADGQGIRRFTVNPASDGMPAWSPDGKAIAFLTERDGRWAIYVKRIDDNRMARLITLQTRYEDWMMERIAWGPAVKLLP